MLKRILLTSLLSFLLIFGIIYIGLSNNSNNLNKSITKIKVDTLSLVFKDKYFIKVNSDTSLYKPNTAIKQIHIENHIFVLKCDDILYTKFSIGLDKSNRYQRLKSDFKLKKNVLVELPEDGVYSLIIYNKVKNIDNRFFIKTEYNYFKLEN